MKNLKIMNFDLKEKYVFNKSIGLEVAQMIQEYQPDIVSVHHIGSKTRFDLQKNIEVDERDNCYNSSNGYMTMFSKKIVPSYSHYFSLKKDINQQIQEKSPSIDGDCLSVVFDLDHHFIAYIDAILDENLSSNQLRKMQNLKKIIEVFSGKSNFDSYGTDAQLVAYNSRINYLIPNLSDVYLSGYNVEHLFADDSFLVQNCQSISSIKGKNGYFPIITTTQFEEKFARTFKSIDIKSSDFQTYSPKVFYKKNIQVANLSLK